MYTEVTRIRKPDPHVHEGDPNSVHTEVAKMAVLGSDICADLSGSWSGPPTDQFLTAWSSPQQVSPLVDTSGDLWAQFKGSIRFLRHKFYSIL